MKAEREKAAEEVKRQSAPLDAELDTLLAQMSQLEEKKRKLEAKKRTLSQRHLAAVKEREKSLVAPLEERKRRQRQVAGQHSLACALRDKFPGHEGLTLTQGSSPHRGRGGQDGQLGQSGSSSGKGRPRGQGSQPGQSGQPSRTGQATPIGQSGSGTHRGQPASGQAGRGMGRGQGSQPNQVGQGSQPSQPSQLYVHHAGVQPSQGGQGAALGGRLTFLQPGAVHLIGQSPQVLVNPGPQQSSQWSQLQQSGRLTHATQAQPFTGQQPYWTGYPVGQQSQVQSTSQGNQQLQISSQVQSRGRENRAQTKSSSDVALAGRVQIVSNRDGNLGNNSSLGWVFPTGNSGQQEAPQEIARESQKVNKSGPQGPQETLIVHRTFDRPQN